MLTQVLFTANGSWVCPAGVNAVLVYGAGGGGAGGGGIANATQGGAGGGGGSWEGVQLVPVTPGTSYSITIGAGGTSGGASTTGGVGQPSKFSTLVSFLGASGGAIGSTGISRGGAQFQESATNVVSNLGVWFGNGGQNQTAGFPNQTCNFAPGSAGAGGTAGGGGGGAGGSGYVKVVWDSP
jgi:hypothetical protein